MNETDNPATIAPVRLGLGSQFNFQCHPGVSCFTLCCRGIQIILTPFDIIQIKNRLGLSSREFLAIYTEPHLLEKTDLPMVTLKLLDDERESCPFVKDSQGCMIYQDRPTSCRYYPLGVATLQHRDGADDDGFFFFVNEPHCKGFDEAASWSVAEWRADQEVDLRDAINREWTDLVVRKRSFPPSIKLTEPAKRMFFMASYDIDTFREFVFESSFLKRFGVDAATVEKIRADEIELLKFGLEWLKSILFRQTDPEQQAAAGANTEPPR